uniref:23S rRNA (uracil(1939)-C(5))-methyltransferase RlmD n=1 Tax=Lachnospira sp. TaxID=2049031 RepID=UPI0040271060
MSYSKNDCVELTIEDIGVSGEGIGKVDGYTLFVKDTVIGDVVRVKIMKAKKNYGYARLMDIIKPSKDRVEPACPIARQCGGCQIQAMNYNAQLKYKQKLVKDNLLRISGLTEGVDYEMCEILGMDTPFRYRNKAQYPVGEDKDGNIVMGFYAGHTHSIIACPDDDCMLGHRDNAFILNAVKEWMKEYRVRAYNENIHKGTVRHVLIRTGYHTDEVMVCLVTKKMLRKEAADGLVKAIQKLKLNVASLVVNINKEDTNVILGKECITLYGRPYIEDYIGDIKFQISPLSFYQVNPKQTEVLYNKALEFAGLKGNESVWDMYCGIGTISLFLAKKAGKVYGVEIVPQAIEDAKNNAKINNIDNAEFFVGKAEEVVPAFYKKQTGVQSDNDSTDSKEYDMTRPDVVVVDPPRKGCDKKLLDTIVSMTPDRIVYVSCDSATLARDLKLLVEYGYKVEKVQPVDQFGNTVHVETVVLLSHKKPDGHINVKVEFGEGEGKVPLDNIAKRAEEYKPKERVTYKMIKEYIEAKYGFKVHTAYIAEVKRDLGLPMYDAPNAVEELKQPRKHPTPEKVEAIKDALKHFEVI